MVEILNFVMTHTEKSSQFKKKKNNKYNQVQIQNVTSDVTLVIIMSYTQYKQVKRTVSLTTIWLS
jgi:hypothetical protein